MQSKKGKKSRGGEATVTVFEALADAPAARELAAAGWPPLQFSARVDEMVQQFATDDPRQPPPPRMVYLMQGMAGAMAARLSDEPLRHDLREQLGLFDEVALWTATTPESRPADRDERPEVSRAWELVEFAAGVLSYLQGDAREQVALPAVASKLITFAISADEFKAVVQNGGLAPDVLAALIPDPASGQAQLPLAQAAEVCFFLSVAVIGGPVEMRPPIAAVIERLAKALDAARPADAEEVEEYEEYTDEFEPISLLNGRKRSRSRRRQSAPSTTGDWYQLKITLQGIQPPIWRRIVVPDCTLAVLDNHVREAMGWDGGHLSCFEIDKVTYSAPPPFSDELLDDSEDSRLYTLSGFVRQGHKKLRHSYDFGDGWEHVIAIEKTISPEEAPKRPSCTAGARACPPEDCGGVWGYQELLEAIKSPKLPENKERLEGLGHKFDAELFSAPSVTRRLSAGR